MRPDPFEVLSSTRESHVSCDFTLTNYAKNRGDVLVIGGGPAALTATTLLPVKLPMFEKLGTRVEAFE